MAITVGTGVRSGSAKPHFEPRALRDASRPQISALVVREIDLVARVSLHMPAFVRFRPPPPPPPKRKKSLVFNDCASTGGLSGGQLFGSRFGRKSEWPLILITSRRPWRPGRFHFLQIDFACMRCDLSTHVSDLGTVSSRMPREFSKTRVWRVFGLGILGILYGGHRAPLRADRNLPM